MFPIFYFSVPYKYLDLHSPSITVRDMNRIPTYPNHPSPKDSYMARRWRNDPGFRVAQSFRARLVAYMNAPLVRGARKRSLFGCTPIEMREHIAGQFRGGMSWENYRSMWEVDHVVLVTLFNLPKEIFPCFHYTNLRPRLVHLNRLDAVKVPKRKLSLTSLLTDTQETRIA